MLLFFLRVILLGETTDSDMGTILAYLTEDVTLFFRAMKGSNSSHPRCIALEGEHGKSVHCNIHEVRSSSCRNFSVNFIDGLVIASEEDYERCTHACARWG